MGQETWEGTSRPWPSDPWGNGCEETVFQSFMLNPQRSRLGLNRKHTVFSSSSLWQNRDPCGPSIYGSGSVSTLKRRPKSIKKSSLDEITMYRQHRHKWPRNNEVLEPRFNLCPWRIWDFRSSLWLQIIVGGTEKKSSRKLTKHSWIKENNLWKEELNERYYGQKDHLGLTNVFH